MSSGCIAPCKECSIHISGRFQRQLGIYLPVVLDVETRFLGLVGDRRLEIQRAGAVIAVAEQEAGECVALRDDAVARLLVCGVRPEAEEPGGVVRLPEVVEEGALLAAELQGVRPLRPRTEPMNRSDS